MAGGNVYCTGSGFSGHKLGKNQFRGAIEERMLSFRAFKGFAFDISQFSGRCEAGLFLEGFKQLLNDNESLCDLSFKASEFSHQVGEARMHRDAEVGR